MSTMSKEAEIHDHRCSAIEYLLEAVESAVESGMPVDGETDLGMTVGTALEAAKVLVRSLTEDSMFLVPGQTRVRWAVLTPGKEGGVQ